MSGTSEKVIAVTGGAGAIGNEICSLFLREGARVVAMDVSADALDRLAVENAHPCLSVSAFDIADESRVSLAFAALLREHGRLDALVCAAGIRPMAPLLDMPLSEWDRCFRVNTTGMFLCNQAAARHMVAARRGTIVNVASAAVPRAVTGTGAYSASKAAVVSMSQVLAAEVAAFGVRVNVVMPGNVESPMIAEQVGEERRYREARIPMGRYGRPEEIAAAIYFLASERASYITGHSLAVDGGYLSFGVRPNVFGR